MILDEADQSSLVIKATAKVEAYALRGVAFEAVIQALVVTVIEPLLLEFPLEVPISLSNKKEIRPCFFRVVITSTQYSAAGGAPARLPQVRSKTAFMTSIAMSQRTPSHWSARSERVPITACRSPG